MNPSLPTSMLEAMNRQPAQGPHPAADLLNAYAERALTAPEDTQIAGHLATCTECREVVFLANSAVELPAPELATEAVPEPRSAWLRWLMPATAVLALAVGFIALERNPLAPDANRPNQEAKAVGNNSKALDDYRPATSEAKKSSTEKVAAPTTGVKATNEKPEAGNVGRLRELDLKNQPPKPAPQAFPAAMAAMAKPMSVEERSKLGHGVGAGSGAGVSGSSVKEGDANLQVQNTRNALYQNQSSYMGGPSQQRQNALPVYRPDAVAQTAKAVMQPQPAPPTPPSFAERDGKDQSASADLTDAVSSVEIQTKTKRNAISRMAAQLWRITPDGHIERMFQNEWHRALGGVQMAFHVVTTAQDHVWAGGIGPRLFHSSDRGEHWDTIEVKTADGSLNGTVESIKTNDARHVLVLTDAGEAWVTSDGGQTWAKQ